MALYEPASSASASLPAHLWRRYCLPSQQHFFMETQSCVVLPDEAGSVQVTSSCQSIDAVQDAVAAALNLPFNKVLVGEPVHSGCLTACASVEDSERLRGCQCHS